MNKVRYAYYYKINRILILFRDLPNLHTYIHKFLNFMYYKLSNIILLYGQQQMNFKFSFDLLIMIYNVVLF